MLDHITLHVNDYTRSLTFFLSALKPLGYRSLMEFHGDTAGLGKETPDLWLSGDGASKPTHIAFTADDRKTVDEFYTAALGAGGQDNGRPGVRELYHPNYYAAFIIDPDGNNIEVVCHKPE